MENIHHNSIISQHFRCQISPKKAWRHKHSRSQWTHFRLFWLFGGCLTFQTSMVLFSLCVSQNSFGVPRLCGSCVKELWLLTVSEKLSKPPGISAGHGALSFSWVTKPRLQPKWQKRPKTTDRPLTDLETTRLDVSLYFCLTYRIKRQKECIHKGHSTSTHIRPDGHAFPLQIQAVQLMKVFKF